jgi:hypothetical protein
MLIYRKKYIISVTMPIEIQNWVIIESFQEYFNSHAKLFGSQVIEPHG